MESDDYANVNPEGQFVTLIGVREQPNRPSHHQLRDLIAPGETAEALYCVNDYNTFRWDCKSGEATVVQSLSYKPTCLTVNMGYIAVGGQRGELTIITEKEGASPWLFNDTVATHATNAVCIGKCVSGETILLASCNDSTMKVFSLPSMSELAMLVLPAPVNYSSLSPCGSYIACVGDCDDVFIFKYRAGTWEEVMTFREWSDAGMCVSWNPQGSALAACSQDGNLCVWDIRSSRLLRKSEFHDPCRCVKFSPAPLDLLAVNQHSRTTHVIDARNYVGMQSLSVPIYSRRNDLTGVTFSRDGTRLFVGVEEKGVTVYDTTGGARTSFATGSLCL